MVTRYQLHVEKWSKGCGSSLCQTAKNVCLGKGQLPSDVCFIGEAPGVSEDVLGLPFVGPAGKELDRWILRSGLGRGCEWFSTQDMDGETPQAFRLSFANLTGCIPLGEDGRKTEEPAEEAITQCSTRLQEWVALAQPKVIVCVGRLAKDYLEQGYKYSVKMPTLCPECSLFLYRNPDGYSCKKGHCWEKRGEPLPQVHIDHPAYVLRQTEAQRGLLARKQIIRLSTVVEMLSKEVKHA